MPRELLIFKALCVVQFWADGAHDQPVKPDITLRFPLAYLFAQGKGERRIYDEFWRLLSDAGLASYDDDANNYMRSTQLNACIQAMIADVGAPGTVDFWQRLEGVVRASSGLPA